MMHGQKNISYFNVGSCNAWFHTLPVCIRNYLK